MVAASFQVCNRNACFQKLSEPLLGDQELARSLWRGSSSATQTRSHLQCVFLSKWYDTCRHVLCLFTATLFWASRYCLTDEVGLCSGTDFPAPHFRQALPNILRRRSMHNHHHWRADDYAVFKVSRALVATGATVRWVVKGVRSCIEDGNQRYWWMW